jgi:cysteinyl-tRNA synthetase
MENVSMKFLNTMGRKKQAFKPLKDKLVSIYSCGPTVYDYAHIGHFRAYVFVDVLKRALEFNGLKVKHVMNITDVGHLTSDADTGEDKVEKKARLEHKSAWEIADFYTKDFFSAMDKLNVQRPGIICKATDHIREMIDFIKKIEKKGYTYRTSDGIYFDTSKLASYGKIAGLNKKKIGELKAGARVEFSAEKKNVTDFALWKFSPRDSKRQMEWSSPWGVAGFPGWHIECSVMSMKYLGDRFDIHTGGVDHINIHHADEIAQSEAITGKNPANFWLHNDFVMVNGEKMAKSKQNFLRLTDIEGKGFESLALRYLFLTAHYRSKMNFTWESIKAAQEALKTLREHVIILKKADKTKTKKGRVEEYRKEFLNAVNDDLNTPEGLRILWKLLRQEKNMSNNDKLKLLLEFDKVLGLNLKSAKSEKVEVDKEVRELVEEREIARKSRDFAKADSIRKRLESEFGIILEDSPEGVRIKRKGD